ncbi:unnamed protein product [Leptosia nina]|uniref:Metalloendopeptidase n=1 Tax=Leptosia nina TaxID=320188 RepID=A0AAV1J034_9NEOP
MKDCVNTKVIEKKRQDTLEICRLFEEQNMLENKGRARQKREVEDKGNGLNNEDLRRVEKIVDKLYDDVNEDGRWVKLDNRRFNFAPASLLGPETKENEAKTLIDTNTNKMPWIKKWYHGIVPYFIDANTYDVQLAELITKAFDYFEKVTCIRLQRLRSRPIDKQSLQSVEWLYITNPSGIRQCVHSNERKPNNGVQMVVIGYDCMSLGEIVHELMHILGFSHEHNRPDRDRHITILWDNIKAYLWYKKYFSLRQEDPLLSLPYDYVSVLHYPPRAFSKNGQFTITAEKGIKIGQREGLSEIDLQKVAMVYNGECSERNKEYLLETCPSVINTKYDQETATPEEIDDYFRERIWPFSIINYKFRDDMEFTTEEKDNIQAVMRHIEKETCIEFRDLNAYKGSSEKEEKSKERLEDARSSEKLTQDTTISLDISNNTLKGNLPTRANVRMTYRIRNTTKVPFREMDNEILDDDTDLDKVKISKPKPKRIKRNTAISPSRRHAANILTLVRTAEPGCECHSPGRPNGHKVLAINGDCFNSVNDLLHFFVHLLGLDHQHNMHDRDSFLKILWDNLTPRTNFFYFLIPIALDNSDAVSIALRIVLEIKSEMSRKLPPAASAGFSYDYQSVMHYPWLQIKDGVTNIMYPIWNIRSVIKGRCNNQMFFLERWMGDGSLAGPQLHRCAKVESDLQGPVFSTE